MVDVNFEHPAKTLRVFVQLELKNRDTILYLRSFVSPEKCADIKYSLFLQSLGAINS